MNENLNQNNYHAASINFRFVRDLPLAQAEYQANLELPRHSHRHSGFCLIIKGGYTESYGNAVLELKPSYVKFQPAGEMHSDVYGKESVHCFIVELEPQWLKRMSAESFVGSDPYVYAGDTVSWLMMKLRREFAAHDSEAAIAIEGIVLDLIAQTSRRRKKVLGKQPIPNWLKQAKDFIADEFSQPLTLSIIAGAVNVHPVYLANSFRRHYGCTIGEYVRQRRVKFACDRISNSRDPLAEVALAAGFANQSHFARAFKQVTGMTPGEYRRTFQGNYNQPMPSN
ncbi:MAG: helix-turn-helix domain-containing protein [Pyrinomonadaceae bacterium]